MKPSLIFTAVFCLIIFFTQIGPAFSKCSIKERIDLGKQGYTKEEVNNICEQDNNEDADAKSSKPDKSSKQQDAEEAKPLKMQPSYPSPLYCCDYFGNKRCIVSTGPGPLGAPCWCNGVPGTGVTCQ